MPTSFEEALAAASRLSISEPPDDMYGERIVHPIISSDREGPPVLAPVEPSEEERLEFLGELPELLHQDYQEPPLQTPTPEKEPEVDCASDLVDGILNALGDGTYLAREPISEDFVLLGPVEDNKELELVYRVFRALLRDKLPITSIMLGDREAPLRRQSETGNFRLTDGSKGLYYEALPVHLHVPEAKDSDILIMAYRTEKDQGVGYILNGWVYKHRG